MPINLLHCERCGANWEPKIANPVACPRCHSPKWHTPSRFKNSALTTTKTPTAIAAADEK